MTTTGGGTPCDLQQYNKYSNIIFSFVCALKAHTRKKINDIEELRPTGSAMLSDGVIYCAFYGFFVFLRAEKKRKKEGAREPWRGTAAAWLEVWRRDAGGRAGGVPAVPAGCLVRIKSKYKCTPYLLRCAVVVYDLFCTTDNLHHAGRACGGGEVVTLAGGLARHTPLSTG